MILRLMLGTLLTVVGTIVYYSWADIVRYLKIRNM